MKDWPEDAVHENGNYSCRCYQCLSHFVGLKRRVMCKECHAKASPSTEDVEETRRFLVEDCIKNGKATLYTNADLTKITMRMFGQAHPDPEPETPAT